MAKKTYAFRGRTVQEAMTKVRSELGGDAFILEKRQIRGKPGILKGLLGGEEMVEIIATDSQESPQAQTARGGVLSKTYGAAPAAATMESDVLAFLEAQDVPGELDQLALSDTALAALAGEEYVQTAAPVYEPEAEAADECAPAVPASARDCDIVEGVRAEIRKFLAVHERGTPAVGEILLEAYERLVQNDVAADIARALVERLQHELSFTASRDPQAVAAALERGIAGMIPAVEPVTLRPGRDRPTVAALVGPTGVGKTTTLVKIAFAYVVKRHKRVGFITEDVRRPGAEAQLKNLAHLLNLPLVEADTPAHVTEELCQMADLDLVLIDTAGRVPRDGQTMAELGGYLEAARPDEVHLVLSSESAEKTLLQAAERFGPTGYDRIVLSKLDETPSYGTILNLAVRTGRPLSYVTTGQEYAETLIDADPTGLARLVLGLDTIAAEPTRNGRR